MKPKSLDEFKYVELCYRDKGCATGYELDRLQVCPSYWYFKTQALTGMGRVQLAKALRRGLIDYDPELLDEVYKCTTCGACQEFCSEPYLRADDHGIMPMLETMRANMVALGFGPLPAQRAMQERIDREHNPYGEPQAQRDAWSSGIANAAGAEVGYFAGCTAAYRQPQMAQSAVRLMAKAGEKFQLLGSEEWCCGSPLIRTGQIERIEELVRNNVEAVRDRGIRKLVVSCAGCYATMRRDYREIAGDLGFEVQYVTEHVADLVKRGKFALPRSRDTVTYHDPCHVRHFWMYDAPRAVIGAIPGVRFVELRRNKDEAFCCGAGGGTKIGYPEWALACAVERVREAQATGANVLLTNCPFCVTNLTEGARELGSSMRVLDLNHYILELAGQAPAAAEPARAGAGRGEQYRCKVCGYTASGQPQMARHMLEHTSEV